MDYLTDLYDGAKQRGAGILEAGQGFGQMATNAYQVGKGAVKAGSGLSRTFGGAALPVLGTVALLAAKGLGAGPLVQLGATGLAQAIKLGAHGIGWIGKKMFGKKKQPHRRNMISRVSLKHKRNKNRPLRVRLMQQPEDVAKMKYMKTPPGGESMIEERVMEKQTPSSDMISEQQQIID